MNIEKLKGHIPDSVYNAIPDIVSKFQINTKERLAHFLSQAAHESGEFKLVVENLNYGAKGLLGTFSKYFDATSAAKYERKPEMIASKVYASRMGNGDEASKEGWKFRGRGYIQLTGKDNYKAISEAVGEDCVANPDLVSTKYALHSAAWFFSKYCLKKADMGATKEAVVAVTKCINGGTIGLTDRQTKFDTFYKLLS